MFPKQIITQIIDFPTYCTNGKNLEYCCTFSATIMHVYRALNMLVVCIFFITYGLTTSIEYRYNLFKVINHQSITYYV